MPKLILAQMALRMYSAQQCEVTNECVFTFIRVLGALVLCLILLHSLPAEQLRCARMAVYDDLTGYPRLFA